MSGPQASRWVPSVTEHVNSYEVSVSGKADGRERGGGLLLALWTSFGTWEAGQGRPSF